MLSGYHYWHQRQDGRVILGGFRNLLTTRGVGASHEDEPSDTTVAFAKQFLPSLGFAVEFEPEYQWTGLIGWSMDGLPWVGPLPARSHEYICAGFSGHGMTQALLAGATVAQHVHGGPETRGHKLPKVDAFLPTKARIADAARQGGDWLSYEQDRSAS